MIEGIGQTLANGCVTGSTQSCLTLSILGIMLILGLTNVIIAILGRDKREEKK